jgi:uncharacterized OsmC-like protein
MKNDVNVAQLGELIEEIESDPAAGRLTFEAETELVDGLECKTTIDNGGDDESDGPEFVVTSDEPEGLLGGRAGPNPVEYVLAALGSCLAIGYSAHGAAMGIEIHEMTFELEGDIDLRGFLGIDDDVRGGYDEIRCTMHLDADGPAEKIEELRQVGEQISPVLDIVQNEVDVQTRIER